MLKRIATTCVAVLTVLTIGSLPIHAQTNSTQTQPDPQLFIDLNRAKNLARQVAEIANGGIGNYRAESSMHGPAFESPYVDNGNGTWTFTFTGSQPGLTTPSMESVITVTRETWDVTIDYNGPIRSTAESE